jgi:uncharacterized membrane protein YkvA (DUF1232 family)
MDTAKRCREQSDECLRLMNLAQSETEARLLRDLAYSWVRIANQTERYAKFIEVQSAGYLLHPSSLNARTCARRSRPEAG